MTLHPEQRRLRRGWRCWKLNLSKRDEIESELRWAPVNWDGVIDNIEKLLELDYEKGRR